MQLVASIVGALIGLLIWPMLDAQAGPVMDIAPAIVLLVTMVVAGGAARFVLAMALAGEDAQRWVRKSRLAHFGDLRGDKVLPFLGAGTATFVGWLYFDGVSLPAPALGLAVMAFAACVRGQPLLDDPWPPPPRVFQLRLPEAKRAAEELAAMDAASMRPCTIQLVGQPDPGDPSRTVKKRVTLNIRAALLEGTEDDPAPFDIEAAARVLEIQALAHAVGRFAARHHLGVVETANVVVRLVLDPENIEDLYEEPENPRTPLAVLSHKRATDGERAWAAAALLTALGLRTVLLQLDRPGKRTRYAVAVPAPFDLGGRMLSVGGRPHLWGAIRPDAPGAFGEPPEGSLGDWAPIAGAPPGKRVHVTG